MLSQFRNNPRMPLIIAVAFLAVVVAGLVMWSRQPDYRVLFSNLSDRDGGAIVAALQQGNIPYKIADAGGAILVPSRTGPRNASAARVARACRRTARSASN